MQQPQPPASLRPEATRPGQLQGQGQGQGQEQGQGRQWHQGHEGQENQWQQQSQGWQGQGREQERQGLQQKPKGVDERALTGQISQAGSTRELLRLSATHSARFGPIHVATLWNKLGKQSDASGPSHREELRRLLRRTVELTGSCGARQLSNVAHGVAKCSLVELSLETSALLTTVAEAAVPKLREFTPQGLANTVWAFATAGHAAPELLDAIAAAAVPQLREFTPQHLANTVWAFATAGHAAPELLDAIAAAAVSQLREFTPQHLANTAWAFVVADHLAPALFDSHDFVQLCAAQHGFTPEGLSQLHQWQLWREERGAAWPALPPELAHRCHAAFCQEGTPSLLQRDVAASLREIGLTPQEEVRTPQGYSLDAVVSEGGFEVAVEVDGPSHFWGRTPTGATALKRRQLRAAGWVLLPVPYWEWNGLGSSEAAKQDYLRAALRGVGWKRHSHTTVVTVTVGELRVRCWP